MKTALVLSGGGARGAFQVGVLKSLGSLGFNYDFVCGTSVGALNAAGLSYVGLERLEQIWRGIKGRDDILTRSWWQMIFGTGLYSLKPLRKLMEQNLIAGARCEAVACFCDTIDDGKTKYASNKDMGFRDFLKFVEASSAIPGIMEPVENRYVDGGVREITPLKYAIQRGVEKIIVILCMPYSEILSGVWFPKFPKAMSYLLRANDIRGQEVFWDDIGRCLKVNNLVSDGSLPDKRHIDLEIYAPDRPLVDALDFDPASIAEMIKHGESVGNVWLPGEPAPHERMEYGWN